MEVSICTRSLTIIAVDRSTLIIPNRPMFLRRECVIRGYIHHIPLDLDTPMSMLGLPIFVHPRTPRPWSYRMNLNAKVVSESQDQHCGALTTGGRVPQLR